MASRRYRAKNSLNSNISHIDTRLSNIETRPAPRRVGANVISTVHIQDQSISSNLISDLEGQLLAPGAVTLVHIGDLAINQDKIMDEAITELKLAANSISEAKIQVNAITSAVIAANAITSEKILAGAVLTEAIAPEAITTAKLAAAAVTANTIAANAIVAGKIAVGAVVANSIAANAIIAEKIAANAITAEKITANAITAEKINANAITAEKIAANTITSEKISSEYVYAGSIVGNQITGGTITGVTVQTLNTGTGSVELNSSNRAIQFRDGSNNVFMNMFPGSVGGGDPAGFYLQYGTAPDANADNVIKLANNQFMFMAGGGNGSSVSAYANNMGINATGSSSSINIESNGVGSTLSLFGTASVTITSATVNVSSSLRVSSIIFGGSSIYSNGATSLTSWQSASDFSAMAGGAVYSVNTGNALLLSRNGSNGSIAAFYRGSTTVVGTISVTTTATAYNTSSDYRLKENLVPIANAIERVKLLQPYRFNFKSEPNTTVDGFVAHEVAAVVPEMVTGEKDAVDENGEPIYQGIDQSKLVPLLTAALQEAIARIEVLEASL